MEPLNIQGWDWLLVVWIAFILLLGAHFHGKQSNNPSNFFIGLLNMALIFGMAWLGGMFQ